jgi:cysteine desulfurase / selenocysteine lyase
MDWNAIREEFPALSGRTYLNTATYGQLPRAASAAVLEHLARRDANACTDFLDWFEDLNEVRQQVGRLIGAQADDIAFVPNASHALALVMNGIDWKDGDEVITLKHEFPNQLYAPHARKETRGVVCKWDELEAHVSERTRLVVLSTVNYETGFRPDLAELIPKLRERGVLVYLDGTQSIGALRFDCGQLQPDFLGVDAYKWMICPNGAAFLYVSPAARRWLAPNVLGWRSDRDWRSVEVLHHGRPRFAESAERYEGGMLPFPSLYAMRASAKLIEGIGNDRIERRVLSLADTIRNEICRLGGESIRMPKAAWPSQILLMRWPNVDSSALAKQLEAEKIHVSTRRGYIRISPHFYNNEADVDALIGALKRLRG